jgi:hypothetical protein
MVARFVVAGGNNTKVLLARMFTGDLTLCEKFHTIPRAPGGALGGAGDPATAEAQHTGADRLPKSARPQMRPT